MQYPVSKLKGLVGFAQAGKVTGGWDGKVIEISTLNDLEQYADDTIPRVLVIRKNISAGKLTKVRVGANKTFVGSFGERTLENIHLRATDSTKNIILQNIVFKHDKAIKANDDIQVYWNKGHGFWIDHCSFVGHQWGTEDGSLDKLLYIGDSADYATISNCYFGNHKYGVILGHPDDKTTVYDGKPHLTICHNHYENMNVRAPGLMRYGYYHVYNNFIDRFNLGFTLADRAKIVSEYNVFGEGRQNKGMLDDKGNGTFTDTGSFPAITSQKSPKSTWSPNSNYSYSLTKNEALIRTFVTANAGARSSGLVFGN